VYKDEKWCKRLLYFYKQYIRSMKGYSFIFFMWCSTKWIMIFFISPSYTSLLAIWIQLLRSITKINLSFATTHESKNLSWSMSFCMIFNFKTRSRVNTFAQRDKQKKKKKTKTHVVWLIYCNHTNVSIKSLNFHDQNRYHHEWYVIVSSYRMLNFIINYEL